MYTLYTGWANNIRTIFESPTPVTCLGCLNYPIFFCFVAKLSRVRPGTLRTIKSLQKKNTKVYHELPKKNLQCPL